MVDAIFSVVILFFMILGCLDGTRVSELPELNFDSVTTAYQNRRNRLIVVYADGLFPNGTDAEKEKLEASLSRLAKDMNNEICLISNEDAAKLRVEYSGTRGVRIIGSNGKILYHPSAEKGYPAQKLPKDEIEVIKTVIKENLGKYGFKYKVKMGVNPLVIDSVPDHLENHSHPAAGLLNLGSVLQEKKHKATKQYVLNPLGIMVDFEHGNDIVYPIDGLKEEDSGVFEGNGATLTPLARDFVLSVGHEAAESFHEAMDKANFFSATVISQADKQTRTNSRLSNIKKLNEILEKLAEMAERETIRGISPIHIQA